MSLNEEDKRQRAAKKPRVPGRRTLLMRSQPHPADTKRRRVIEAFGREKCGGCLAEAPEALPAGSVWAREDGRLSQRRPLHHSSQHRSTLRRKASHWRVDSNDLSTLDEPGPSLV
jgi:hypothetical protein